jgi:hypothetical protein
MVCSSVFLFSFLVFLFFKTKYVYFESFPYLRGGYLNEKKNAIETIMEDTYSMVYKGILQKIVEGKSKASFTLLCFVEYYNPSRSIIIGMPEKTMTLQKTYNISLYELHTPIIEKLEKAFPNSILIWEKEENPNTNPNNCVHYTFVL